MNSTLFAVTALASILASNLGSENQSSSRTNPQTAVSALDGPSKNVSDGLDGPRSISLADGLSAYPDRSLEQGSTVSVCAPKRGNAGVDPPRSQGELDAIVSGYLGCGSRFFSALDNIYEREKRNEAWASQLEERVRNLAKPMTSIRVRGQCHGSVCRFDFDTAQTDDCAKLVRGVDRPLVDTGRGTELQVSVFYHPTLTGCRRYILSTVVPPVPAYFEPLREMIEGGS